MVIFLRYQKISYTLNLYNVIVVSEDEISSCNPDISLEFRVFLVNAQTGAHTQESRILRFWFKPIVRVNEQSTIAQHMFKDLVSPNKFPRGIFFSYWSFAA